MRKVDERSWIAADWPAPECILAGCTTRLGGVSRGGFAGFNLAMHVGDEPAAVEQNRAMLKRYLGLPHEPYWLEQVHGCVVATATTASDEPPQADASTTREAGRVCIVMTADCLPVLITDEAGSQVAAVHAGWRGLEQRIILSTLEQFSAPVTSLLVWLGPAIGPQAFEVGAEVREQFVQQGQEYQTCFVASGEKDKWLMDIYAVARIQLASAGVTRVYGGGFCTYQDSERFYSYRRDKATGRMASLICMRS